MVKHIHFTQSSEISLGGGLLSSALQLHDSMLKLGVESYFISTYRTKYALRLHSNYKNIFLFKEEIPSPFFVSARMFCAASVFFSSEAVYHSHGLHTFPQFVFSQARIPASSSLVIHPHGFLDPYIVKRSRYKKRIAKLLFEHGNFKSANLWRALTQKEGSQISSLNPSSQICIIPNGIPPSTDAPVRSSLLGADRRKVVLFLGRIHPKKNVELLISAWKSLYPFYPTWRLVIAGPFSSIGYKKNILNLVSSCELESHVDFLGSVEDPEKTSLYHSVDLFVLPSSSEGLPMSVLEAASCATPVLLTPDCNLPELIGPSLGFSCLANKESLQRALIRVFNTSSADMRLRGVNLRHIIDQNFRWPVLAKRLIDHCELIQ